MYRKRMPKKITLVFISAFLLDWLWEIAHSVLYLSYQGGPITHLILFRAAAADAAMIAVLVLAAGKFVKNKSLFVAAAGLVLAVAIETWALKTGRWTYGPAMPVIPILRTGLTPTIQLALIGCLVQKLVFGKIE